MAYKTFKRSYCKPEKEPHGLSNNFLISRKITVDTGLTYEEARCQCEVFNRNRTPAQIRKGTMMEFTEQ